MIRQILLTLKKTPDIPIEAENLVPEKVNGKNEDEIGSILLLAGKNQEPVRDWFTVNIVNVPESLENKQAGQADLVLRGDLTRFKRLGESMSSGSMLVEGSVGFHAGAKMSGGVLTIRGDAGDFLGAHMKGGLLIVEGNAGHYAASAYRGHLKGMAGGTIIITGSAGQMLGARMRRGLIYVQGDCGDAAGFNMKAGTIIVAGAPGPRTGARMVRGTIMLLGQKNDIPELLPTFTCNCTYTPPFWGMIIKAISEKGFEPKAEPDTLFARYSGDNNEGGMGEILIRVRNDRNIICPASL